MSNETVRVYFEGEERTVPAGITVAAALLGHGHPVGHTRVHPLAKDKRAPYCMMGVCFECLMEIDGIPHRQACLTVVADGMRVRREFPEGEDL